MLMYKFKVIITTEEETIQKEAIGSFLNGVISYQENNNTYVYLDINKDELIRENDQILMKYAFKENRRSKGLITIKEMNKELDIDIETTSLIKKDNYYYIEYKIEENKFIYELSYTEE